MKKKYVVIRRSGKGLTEPVSAPMTKKEAEILCQRLTGRAAPLTSYTVEKIGSTLKKITHL